MLRNSKLAMLRDRAESLAGQDARLIAGIKSLAQEGVGMRSSRGSAKRAKVLAQGLAGALVVGAMLSGAAQAAGPYEPNDVHTQAVGPVIAPSTYDALLETSVDQDYFFFYAASAPGRALIGTLSNHAQPTGGIEDYGRIVGITVYDNSGHAVESNDDSTDAAAPQASAAFRWNLAPGRYYAVISHGYDVFFQEAPRLGDVPYTLSLSSGGDSFDTVQQNCQDWTDLVADVKHYIADEQRRLAKAKERHDRRAARHWRRAIRRFKRRLAADQRQANSYCSIPQ